MSSLASRATTGIIVWVKGMLSMTPPIVPPTHTSSVIATARRIRPARSTHQVELNLLLRVRWGQQTEASTLGELADQ